MLKTFAVALLANGAIRSDRSARSKSRIDRYKGASS